MSFLLDGDVELRGRLDLVGVVFFSAVYSVDGLLGETETEEMYRLFCFRGFGLGVASICWESAVSSWRLSVSRAVADGVT